MLLKADLKSTRSAPAIFLRKRYARFNMTTRDLLFCNRTVRGGGLHPVLGMVVGMGGRMAICPSTVAFCVHGPP